MSTSTALAMQDPDERRSIVIPPKLADAGLTVVTTAGGVRAVVIPNTMYETHNIVRPVNEIAQADPDWSPRFVEVYIDPTLDKPVGNKPATSGRYVYVESKKLALRKEAILLLADAAGIDVQTSRTPRAELDEDEIGYDAVAFVRRSDGTLARYEASKVIDVAMEREMIIARCTGDNGFDKNYFRREWFREKGHLRAKCESKAVLRAVAAAMQLKRGGYTDAELRKPFLIVAWSMTPQDPEVRRQRLLNAEQGAYGRHARQLASAPEPQPEEEAVEEPVAAEPDEEHVDEADVVVEHEGGDPGASEPNEEELVGEPEAIEESTPVAGEIPPAVVAAGEFVIPFGKHKGRKITEVAHDPKYPTQIKWLATEYAPGSAVAAAHAPLIEAARTWHNWASEQEARS